jgi:hypothetical protein
MIFGLRWKFLCFAFLLIPHSLHPCTTLPIHTCLAIGVIVARPLQIFPVTVPVPREHVWKQFRFKYICKFYNLPSTSHVIITSQNQASQKDSSRMEAKRAFRKQWFYLIFTRKHTCLIATHYTLPEELTEKLIDSCVLCFRSYWRNYLGLRYFKMLQILTATSRI